MTNNKPADLFFDRSARINYQGLTNFRKKVLEDVSVLIKYGKGLTNEAHNKTRSKPTSYNQGDKIFVVNKQIKTKEKPRFRAENISLDRNVTVKTKTGNNSHI